MTIKSFCLFVLSFMPLKPAAEELPGNLTDFSKCKLSHLGLEYQGDISKTEGGIRCQSWSATIPVHKIDPSLTDDDFVDFSRKDAKSYCRNPNKNPMGPWCYSMDPTLIDDTCAVPLCSLAECKLTGPGMEYAGSVNRGISDRKCLKWSKDRNRVRQNGTVIQLKQFGNNLFPDGRAKDAKKFCRNPNGDIGGPWCFVEIEEGDEVEREYCDISFCDDQDCSLFTKNDSVYGHYTDLNESLTNISFGIKLWDSDSYLTAHAKLLISLVALPLSGEELDRVGAGFEVILSNKESGLTYGSKGEHEFEPTHGILKSTEYTFFSLSWTSGFLSLNREGETKPIFLAEFNIKDNLMGYAKDKFKFYSAQGTNILWTFPFCDDDFDCDVHTTTTSFHQQFWPLRQTESGHDLVFHLRGVRLATLLFVPSPALDYPSVTLTFRGSDNHTKISLLKYHKAPVTVLWDIDLPNMMEYWKWHEFSISLFANTFTLYWKKDADLHMLVELKHDVFRQMRWYSPASGNSVVHWTFFCAPPRFALPPNAWLPECALSAEEPNYKGTQDITNLGLPCLPWSAKIFIPEEVNFQLKESLEAWNYCRDPEKENEGTYCYTISRSNSVAIEKSYCHLRKCKSTDCKVAGTGNDYIGKVSVTRSNRTCQPWVVSNTTDQTWTYVHKMPSEYLNGTLYADMSAEAAENFCRNPSRNVAGSWCYTDDPRIPADVCNIRDCDMREECIIVTRGVGGEPNIYILPQWKETGIHGGLHFGVKEWNPDLLDGIYFIIRPMYGNSFIRLMIGAENNEKIQLYYNNVKVKEKTFPRLIPAGKWALYWLQMRKGEILFGYQGVPTPLFEWKHDDPSKAFTPAFMNYLSINGDPIGLYFKCDECHTENTTTKRFSKLLPVGIWVEMEQPLHKNLTLRLRGTGVALIPLIISPGSNLYHGITIGNIERGLSVTEYYNKNKTVLSAAKLQKNVIVADAWTEFFITFEEHEINITCNGTQIMHHTQKSPLIVYWFSIGTENGWLTWAANCAPLDIDGPPRDGGWSAWSPWQCTVSCGGGEGVRTRTCSNPRPNIFGEMCEGLSSSTGICNDFECGDISPDTLEKIHQHLQTELFSFKIEEGGRIILKNDHEILSRVSTESPEAYYEWTLNGIFLKPEKGHITFVTDDIHLENARTSDTGTYVCVLYRINKQKVILRTLTLAVVPKEYMISTRATLPLTLKTNAVVLGYIYSDLRQKWLLNKKVYIDYGVTTLAAVSTEHFKSLNESHTGQWECVIEQSDLKLNWTTNYVKVLVKKKPNFYTHLMEDRLTRPLFGWLKTERNVLIALIFIVCFVVAIVSTGLVMYLKYGRLPGMKSRYKKNRRM